MWYKLPEQDVEQLDKSLDEISDVEQLFEHPGNGSGDIIGNNLTGLKNESKIKNLITINHMSWKL